MWARSLSWAALGISLIGAAAPCDYRPVKVAEQKLSKTGAPLALIDGQSITVRRTSAASALASRYLSRPDATRMVMIGTGALAPHMIGAHAAVRPASRWTVRRTSRCDSASEASSSGPAMCH